MRLIVFETEEWEHSGCLGLSSEHEVTCTRERLDAKTAENHTDAEAITVFVNSTLDADALARFPSLRLIVTRSAGYDHVDLEYCRARGIIVSNVPDYGDYTVAEYVFALVLALSRHLIEAATRTQRGDFSQSNLRGFDLRGKTLGVVGTGRIGRRTIEIARGFAMDVVAFDLHPNEALADSLGFRYSGFADVLAHADVLTLHVPATPKTHHLISDREFAAMKEGAVLVNTARGDIVDTSALVRALADKRLAAAGLDVLPEEPLMRDEAEIFRKNGWDRNHDLHRALASHVLLHFPNVIITPHIAFNTDGALRRILDTTLSNIRAFARGQPQNVVNAVE
jgi:D-lactate dehydrogenase